LGRWSVRVGCCVSQVVVDMMCSREIVRVYGGVNEAVVID